MEEGGAPGTDARAVANYMLEHATQLSLSLTNLSVQKLVFFAHGICIAIQSQPLIRNAFEAWDHGPVVPALYDAFKGSRASPIRDPALWYDWDQDKHVPVPPELRRQSRMIVNAVLLTYGHMDGLSLSDLTHEVGSPWYVVRYPPRGMLYLNNRIPDDLIGRFFERTSKEIHRRALEEARRALISFE